MQEKLKIASTADNTNATADAKENASQSQTPSGKPSAIRQLSRGQLGLGENSSSMASTVLSAMRKKDKDSNKDAAAAATKPKPSTESSQNNSQNATPQPKKPVNPPAEKEVAAPQKESSANNANNRRRHDSQSKNMINIDHIGLVKRCSAVTLLLHFLKSFD